MLLTSLKAVGVADILDIALVSVLIYAILVWFKQAKAAGVAKGMLVATAVYLLSRGTGMVMTTSIFHGFFAILLVALVVIFQEELRTTFERIAVWSLSGSKTAPLVSDMADDLARTIGDLARERNGALIVLAGEDPLDRHLEAGWPLDGEFSEALLKSIFDDHSMGHDGAVVLEGSRVKRFGARLPLSKEFAKTAKLGTRHTAALGIAELTDALCIVVSEERGTISVAREGTLEKINKLSDLADMIRAHSPGAQPLAPEENFRAFLSKNSREKALAVFSALALWAVFVLGAKGWQQDFEVAVRARGLPPHLQVSGMRPDRIRATFSGLMRDFYWVDRRRMSVDVELSEGREGVNRLRIGDLDVRRPAGFFLEDYSPQVVEIVLEKRPESAAAP